MSFSGYREDHRGYWFSDKSQAFLYTYNEGNEKGKSKAEFYLINEREQTITKVADKEFLKLLVHLYSLRLDEQVMEWLKDEKKSGLKYFENLDELDKYEESLIIE